MKYNDFFEFYSTFVEGLTNKIPITIPYNLTPAKRKALDNHKSYRFIHSGNWWNIKNPEMRSKEKILENQLELCNDKTVGFMSKNVQPGDRDLIDEENRLLKKYKNRIDINKFTYWIMEPSDLTNYFKLNIENANWARDNNRSNVSLYCAIQVIDFDSASEWFEKAVNEGHTHFCIGVSEFLKYPKYKKQGIERLFEIAMGTREVIGEKFQLHFSGVSSLFLLPILASLGVSSFDGSTPVQSALAYGTIFNEKGYSQRANDLKNNKKKHEKFFNIETECDCEVCYRKTSVDITEQFTQERKSRVIHNLYIWRKMLKDINTNCNHLEKYLERLNLRFSSNYFKSLLKIKDNVLDKH